MRFVQKMILGDFTNMTFKTSLNHLAVIIYYE